MSSRASSREREGEFLNVCFESVQCAQEGLAGVSGPTQVILGCLCSGCDPGRKQEGLGWFAPVLWNSESLLKLLQGDKCVNSLLGWSLLHLLFA